MNAKELNGVLNKHAKWLRGEKEGKRADLRGAYLRGADLRGADLRGADLRGADLQAADLRGADLTGAVLTGADLAWADLTRADLTRADLAWANLYRAKGVNKYRTTPLYILADQPGKIRAYKMVNTESEGIYQGGIKYETGQSYSVDEWDGNEQEQCGAGINLATLDWCLRYYQPGYRILIAEFTAKDIVAIPIGSDGKFRVKRCKIVGEKDLVELGLEEARGNK